MNVIQRFAARLLPEEWFVPANMDRYWGAQVGVPITASDVNWRIASARAGDTRTLSGLKAEMRSVDGDLESHIGKIEGMLAGAPLELVAPKDPKADEITAFCREQLLDPDLDLPGVIKHALWGLLDGAAPFQVVMRPDGKGVRLSAITPVPSERVFWPAGLTEPHIQPDANVGDHVPVDSLGAACAVLIVDRHVLARDRVGLLRRCVSPWLTKLYGFDWWRHAVELHGTPYRKAKYRGGVDLVKLEASLKGMGNSGYGMFPDNVDLEFMSQVLGSRNAHEDLVGYCDREKAKVLLGGTQTADIQQGSGSKASAGVHERVLETTVDGYGRQIGAFLRSQILKPLVTIRYGAATAEQFTPVPTLRVKSNADLGAFFAAMKTAGEAGMTTIPRAWVHTQTGIPMPEEGEECLEAKAPTPQLAPAGVPEDPEDVAEPAKKAASSRRKAAAAARRRPPAALLEDLEAWALSAGADAGKDLVAPYAALIEEVRKDGGDLGHLAARVRLQASMASKPPQETADLIAMVCAHAMLTGFTTERA